MFRLQIFVVRSKTFAQVSDLSRGINEEIFIKWKDSSFLCQPWAEANEKIGKLCLQLFR
jgi:hypothetical protein